MSNKIMLPLYLKVFIKIEVDGLQIKRLELVHYDELVVACLVSKMTARKPDKFFISLCSDSL